MRERHERSAAAQRLESLSVSDEWKPKLAAGVQLTKLTLTAAEGFAVSRIDGATTAYELALLTGMRQVEVNALLERLQGEGVLEGGAAAPAPAPEEEDEQPPAVPEDAEGHATLLKLYSTRFKELSEADRVHHAETGDAATLSALAFDPLPSVIRALLANPRCGPEQGRLIAAHHRTGNGLELLLARQDLIRDAQVQRMLWRNPQLNEGQVKRLTAAKRLLEVWKLSVSREATAQTRAALARALRAKFSSAGAEEKVELIFNTEGRALAGLAGLPIDGRATSLLCARTVSSMMLVQSIAHWAVAPPALIGHLLKQQLVMRQPRLRQMLQAHPNAPASAKKL